MAGRLLSTVSGCHHRGLRVSPGVWFAMPWFAGLFGLMLLPIVLSVLLSFSQWDGVSLRGIHWVGLGNYRQMVGVGQGEPLASDPLGSLWCSIGCRPLDPLFYKALYNSFVYTLMAVPAGLAGSLGLAMLLNQKLRGMAFFRTLYYMPHVLGGVATIMIWRWIYNPDFGLANEVLRGGYRVIRPAAAWLGLGDTASWAVPGWLYSAEMAKVSVVLMGLWGAGGAMLIFLAALQNVPERLYEAARIDGAGRWRQFRHVTLPQISPAILFNLIIGIIGSMQMFSQAYLLRTYGQKGSLLFYVLYLYSSAFEDYRMGYAAALGWGLFVVILIVSGITLLGGRRWVHYE